MLRVEAAQPGVRSLKAYLAAITLTYLVRSRRYPAVGYDLGRDGPPLTRSYGGRHSINLSMTGGVRIVTLLCIVVICVYMWRLY